MMAFSIALRITPFLFHHFLDPMPNLLISFLILMIFSLANSYSKAQLFIKPPGSAKTFHPPTDFCDEVHQWMPRQIKLPVKLM